MKSNQFMPVLLVIFVFLFCFSLFAFSPKLRRKETFPNLWPVIRIINADTIVIRRYGRLERVKLLGIESPAKGSLGYEQAFRIIEKLINGRKVFIEFSPNTQGKWDRDGRLLGYIFYDNKNMNVEMVRSGWARWQNDAFGQYAEKFQYAQEEAKKAKRGLWKEENI